MKKLVLILALAGFVGSVSATTLSTLTHTSIVILKDDGKKKKSKKDKKECKDGDKCCSKDGDKKGGCCKDKEKAAEPKPQQ